MKIKAPILTYHNLSIDADNNRYTIEKRDFLRDLQFLHANGYKCITADSYYELLLNELSETTEMNIVITLDDGHESDFRIALPILREFHFKATFFITTDWINKPGYLKKDQIRRLRQEGMSVQSHAKTHRFLDEMNNGEVFSELSESKNVLEDVLGEKVSFISFPGGRFNRNVIECAKAVNYFAAFCSRPFYLRKLNGIHLIGRCMIKHSDDRGNFERVMRMNRVDKLKEEAAYIGKVVLKKLLGNRSYYYIWKQYIGR